jgi:dynein heavy chain
LDGKRRSFPRFYFVSQAGLLDILSNGNSPEKINKHMSKIFQAVDTLELEADGERPKAKTMISAVGKEKLDLTKPMKMLGKVESYLADLINAMRSTLNDITRQSVQCSAQMKRDEWLLRDPA